MRYSEQQVSSALLDQPPFAGKPLKLFICSTPRSGSYLLCRYMINAGLGVPHEYFNPIIMRQMAPRLGLPEVAQLQWRPPGRRDRLPFAKAARAAEVSFLDKYLAALVPLRCQGGVFAAKIHFDQFLKVLNNPAGLALLNGGLFIHLYREDLLKQAISAHFAHLTGRWSIDETLSTEPVADPDFFDFARLEVTLQDLAEEDRGWRIFFAQNGLPAISISYEQVCADPYQVIKDAARRLGIDPGRLRQDYREAAAAEGENDRALPSKSEVLRRYIAARAKIHSVQKPAVSASAGKASMMRGAAE